MNVLDKFSFKDGLTVRSFVGPTITTRVRSPFFKDRYILTQFTNDECVSELVNFYNDMGSLLILFFLNTFYTFQMISILTSGHLEVHVKVVFHI